MKPIDTAGAYRSRKVAIVRRVEGVIGRDVLASLRLLLDGPGREWTEERG